MTDERPRPQYGEYAPEGWVSPHYPPPNVEDVVTAAPAAPVVARRSWDVALTVALLVLGLYTVLSGYIGFSSLPQVFDQLFTQMGVGDFSSDAAANAVGIAANIVQTVLWLAGAVLGWRALRANRIAFWWPLGAGILANLIVVVMVGVVIAMDPAYAAYLAQQQP